MGISFVFRIIYEISDAMDLVQYRNDYVLNFSLGNEHGELRISDCHKCCNDNSGIQLRIEETVIYANILYNKTREL